MNLIGLSTHFDLSENLQRVGNGSVAIWEAIHQRYGNSQVLKEKQALLRGSQKIRHAVGCFNSIDRLIHAHNEDATVATCAKLAIVEQILVAERNSKLASAYDPQVFTTQAFRNTWYRHFMDGVTEGLTREDRNRLFENVSVVCFNYDRCIETYIECWLIAALDLLPAEARALARSLEILRPYGLLGPLTEVPFGGVREAELFKLSDNVRTFTEQFDDGTTVNAIRKRMAEAETIVFLGFGFDELNLQLLRPAAGSAVKRVFATSYGIPEPTAVAIHNDIEALFEFEGRRQPFPRIVFPALTCEQLMHQYSRPMRASS